MIGLRSIISTALRARPLLKTKIKTTAITHASYYGPPQPFDNLPFSIPNRYVATLVFTVFFGVGLWAPFPLLWYMMAKRSL